MKLFNAFTYIVSNKNRTTFYIGVTSDLERRIEEHRNGIGSAFTKKYNLHDLVYFERMPNIAYAIKRERQLKEWKREWKLELIKTQNPTLEDLLPRK